MFKQLLTLLALIVVALPLSAQITVTGKVTDENKSPLPGANIVVKGTTHGVSSDFEGNYEIQAKEGDVLEFSFVGFQPQTKKVGRGNKVVINVVLQEDAQQLEDVVVVGYGTQKKENLTGAVATVDAKVLDSRPLTNIGQGLQGLVPNLNISMGSGRPGTGTGFNIRGFTSINGGSPLVLVDGVQMDPNQINPNDVENVTILKDAASAAIYGGRAAFGVVLITTKQGKKGAPLQVNVSTNYSLTRPTRLPKLVNSLEYLTMYLLADEAGGISGGSRGSQGFGQEDIDRVKKYMADPRPENSVYIDPTDPRKYRYVSNTDWIKEMYPDWAPQSQHNISISGGSEKTTYIASAGMFEQQGLFKVSNQKFNRYNLNLGLTSDVTKWLTIGVKSAVNRKHNDQPSNGRNDVETERFASDLKPLMPVYHPDGNFSGQGGYTNPFAIIATGGRDKYTSDDIWITGNFILTPIKNVKIVGDYTWNSYRYNDKTNVKRFKEYGAPSDGVSIFDPTKATDLGFFPHTNTSRVDEGSSQDIYKAANIYAQYENTFANDHYLKAMVGYSQEEKHNESFWVSVKNLINQDYPYIKLNNDEKPSVRSGISDWALIGSFFRLNYTYAQKYLLEINGRYDGSSKFSKNNRYVFSPSASIGWRVSKEKFFAPLEKVVSDLKFRVSYGDLPNQYVGENYPYLATMDYGSQTGYLFGNTGLPYINAPGLVSDNFTWETVETRNIGVDYGFFDNRLSGSFDYYIRNTKGMLVGGLPLPKVLGTGSPQRNAADLETKGFEFSIGWKDQISDDFSYNISFNLADSRSFITKFDLNPTGNLGQYYVGREIGEIWGYTSNGLYQTDADAAITDKKRLAGYKWLAGDVKFEDSNGDGKIDWGDYTLENPGDLSIIGNNRARYTFGFNMGINYKDFDFSLFLQGVAKRDYALGGTYFWGFTNEWAVPTTEQLDYWTPDNPNAYFPRQRFGGGNFQTSTRYLQDASYVRLKQITLGYTLPKEVMKSVGMDNLRVYLTGENVMEFTKLIKSYDPELLGQYYPLNRVFTFGVQARF